MREVFSGTCASSARSTIGASVPSTSRKIPACVGRLGERPQDLGEGVWRWGPPRAVVCPPMSSRLLRLAVIATAAGAFSGLFGVGGGTVMVPLLILWLGYGEQRGHRHLARRHPGHRRGRRRCCRGCTATSTWRKGLLVGVPAIAGVRRRDRAAAARLRARGVGRVRGAARGLGGRAGVLMSAGDADRPRSRSASPPGSRAGCSASAAASCSCPALALVLGLSQLTAESTSLLAIVPVAIVGRLAPARATGTCDCATA